MNNSGKFVIKDNQTGLTSVIGPHNKPPVIAELGINHNGSLKRAKEMVNAAKQAGASLIKVQTFDTDEFMSGKSQTYTYISQGKKVTESMYEMFKRCELTFDEFKKLFEHIRNCGLIPFSTATDIRCAKELMKYELPAVKVGSDDLVNIPLLRELAGLDIPMIISTGMGELHEIKRAVSEIENSSPSHKTPLVMICTSTYPAPDNCINLNRTGLLKNELPHIQVGFSDHSQSWQAAFLAVGCGTSIIEKHFTLDNNLAGPDHWFSNNPTQLKELVTMVNKAWEIMGESCFTPTPAELAMRIEARRSITAARDIPKGKIITLSDLVMQRPGSGIMPDQIDEILEKKIKLNIPKGTQLDMNMFT